MINHSRVRVVLATALLVIAFPLQALAAPVHLEVEKRTGLEHGAGISVGKGSECFIVVPHHVVQSERGIKVTDKNGRSASAEPFQEYEEFDASLLKVEKGHSLDCPEDWDDGAAGDSVLQEADFLISRKVKQRGMQQRRGFLGGDSSTTISIQPYSPTESDRFVEGDSGSSLYAKNRLVGMVVAVDTATGEGTALRQSQLHALFGSLVLEQSVQRALVNPVYFRNREDRYASVGLRDFVDAETELSVVTLDAATAAANLQGQRRGVAPKYPPNLDYVVSALIIDNRARNEANPNYKASAAKEKNFGKQILNSIGNRGTRYIYVANIDVEVQILEPEQNQQITHLAQLEYKVPLTEDVDRAALQKQLPTRATVDATREAMLKYGLPVRVAEATEEKEDTSILGLLLNGKD